MSAPASSARRVFISGALGFIGHALGERYRAAGAEVRGVDLRADPASGVVAGDITEPGAWQEHAAGCDLVVHTAAIVSNAFDLDSSWRVNVLGTRRVLDAAMAAGAGRCVHISSVRAFSDESYPPDVDEGWPVRPDGNPYVDTKIASEQVALQAHAAGELEVAVARPGDVYGPGSRPWTLLPLELIKARRFALPAMGKGVFSPAYVDNVVDGLVLLGERPEAAGQVFTISDGVGVSCSEFFGHHHRMLGRRGPLVLPTSVAIALAEPAGRLERLRGRRSELNAISMRYLARPGTYSIDKARRVLGYEPRVGLEEGMRLTEAWLRREGLL
jgi:nucleoside-diphosphate-sugar epimerase